jgi:hypothetical protein
VKQWFTNRASAVNSGTRRDNLSWTPLLKRLHQIRNTHPRLRTPTQQFMRDYPAKVKKAFAAQYGNGNNLSKADRLNFQNSVAKKLLYEENTDLIDELQAKAKAQHTAGKNEWNMILEDISAAENVAQYVFLSSFLLPDPVDIYFVCSARDTLFDAVYPLLQAIGTYAGCYVTLVAGNTGKDNSPGDGFLTA